MAKNHLYQSVHYLLGSILNLRLVRQFFDNPNRSTPVKDIHRRRITLRTQWKLRPSPRAGHWTANALIDFPGEILAATIPSGAEVNRD